LDKKNNPEFKKYLIKEDDKLREAIYGDENKLLCKPIRLFLVEMLRYGSRENHSYNVGVYSSYKKALKIAHEAMDCRGGKYDAVIHEVHVDENDAEVYRVIRWGDKYEE
jgi:cytosine/adenosine deaminase-related metal-dependent hydrolase